MRTSLRSLFLVLVLLFCVGSRLTAQAQSPDSSKLVLAFYYTWYDENTWIPEKVVDMPLEPYASRDRNVMAQHVEQAKSAGIDALVASWYGPQVENNQTETNFAALLDVAQERDLKVAADFETASPFMNSQGEVIGALQHLLGVHASKESYLKVDGRPVIFFWAIQHVPLVPDQSSALDAWRAIRQQVDPERNSIWIAEGVDIGYQEAFDGHHLYNIAWSKNVAGSLTDWKNRVRKWASDHGQYRIWVATVMPGWNDLKTGRASAYVRDRENGAFYRECWEGAIATQPDWIIITSFNEWIENSYIEPSQSYGNTYLDLTRELSQRFKFGPAAVEPEVSSPADASQPDEPLVTPVPAVSLADTPTPEPTSPPTSTKSLPPVADPQESTVLTPTVSLVASLTLSATDELNVAPELTPGPASGDRIVQNVTQDELAATEAAVTGVITDSKVPMRDGPGREYPVVGLLHQGFVVVILQGEPDAGWLRVTAPTGEIGYVEAQYVDWDPVVVSAPPSPPGVVTSAPISQVEEEPTPRSVLALGTVITDTKLRTGPSTGFGQVTKLGPGDELEIVGTNLDASWYQARLPGGQEGWVLAYKVERATPTAVPGVTVTLPVSATEVPSPEPEAAPTMPLTGPIPITQAIVVSPTLEAFVPAVALPSQGGLLGALSGDSPRRSEALLGLVLIVAGMGILLVAVASTVLHFSSRRKA